MHRNPAQAAAFLVISGLGLLSTGFQCLPGNDAQSTNVDSESASNDLYGTDDANPSDSGPADPGVPESVDNDGGTPVVIVDPSGIITATYQAGVNGYAGAKAVAISDIYAADYNLYQGTTFTDDADWCIGDIPARGYDESPLMRFENLNLPAGAKVVSASLTLVFSDVYDGGGQRVIGHYLNVPWALQQGYGGSGVGWSYRETGVPWDQPGARGEGTDVLAGKNFQSEPLVEGARQKGTLALDPEVVQSWIDDPSRNHGVVLTTDLVDHHVEYRQPQNAVVEDRPVLTIMYYVP
jgi:hypothetical protein